MERNSDKISFEEEMRRINEKHIEEMRKLENERIKQDKEYKEEIKKMEKEHQEKIEVQEEKMRREQKEKEEKFFRQVREQNEELKRIQNQNEENLRRLQIQQEENLRRLQVQQEENLRRIQIQHEEDLRRFRMMLSLNMNIPSQAFDEEILKKLNKFVFNDDIKDKNGNIEKINCCICLNDIKKNEEVVKLPCNHIHHWKCCVNWLKQKSICPMCRFEIKK